MKKYFELYKSYEYFFQLLPSNPANASASIDVIKFPSSSNEFSCLRWEKTLAGIVLNLLCARISESKFLKPSKSPSRIVSIRFSWTSSFFKLSKIASAFCGITVRWFPPKFNRFNFLWQYRNVKMRLFRGIDSHTASYLLVESSKCLRFNIRNLILIQCQYFQRIKPHKCLIVYDWNFVVIQI